jgi:hypothetical protein
MTYLDLYGRFSQCVTIVPEDIELAKDLKCSQYQKYHCNFFPSSALCPLISSLSMSRHVLGPCYAHFGLVSSLEGVQNMVLGTLQDFMSVKRGRL